ncbi:MAG: hypothetical protein H7096_01810 [Flavobacterium sp.]|nr:hypothetical protein [Pedobacter sp.]
MNKQLAKIYFSYFFLFILLSKMVISAMPIITTHFDSKNINEVIMQLEIETAASSNSSGKILDLPLKGDWFDKINHFNFHSSFFYLSIKYFIKNDLLYYSFYPSVITPPPSV